MVRLTIVVVLALAASHATAAEPVDLELALGIDVSGSVDDEEARLQREGYIAAFRHPDVIRAIQGGFLQRIAVAYYEWAGYGHHRVIAGWTMIDGAAAANAFADKLTLEPPQTASRTAIASAIEFSVTWFEGNDFEGTRRVVDISGDGPNNWGNYVTVSRDKAIAAGVTINGLPIINDRPGPSGWSQMRDLDLYYRNCVIGGPGAFIVVANTFEDFATAVRRKLILEISGRTPPARLMPAQARIAPPCDSGERAIDDRDDY